MSLSAGEAALTTPTPGRPGEGDTQDPWSPGLGGGGEWNGQDAGCRATQGHPGMLGRAHITPHLSQP